MENTQWTQAKAFYKHPGGYMDILNPGAPGFLDFALYHSLGLMDMHFVVLIDI